MEVTIKNDKLRRTACYVDVVSIRQDNKRLIIMDKEGWTTAFRLYDDVVVTITGCEV